MRRIFAFIAVAIVVLRLPLDGQIQLTPITFDNFQPLSFGNAARIAQFSAASTITGNSPSVSGNNVLGVVVVLNDIKAFSGVTWNGVSMTACAGASASGASFVLGIYYLVNPAAGVSTVTASVTGGNFNSGFAGVYYIPNVNPVNPVDNCSTATGTAATTFTGTATVNAPNEMVIADTVQTGNTSGLSAGSGSTQATSGTSGGANFAWNTTYRVLGAASGSTSMIVNSGSSNPWAQSLIVLRSFGR